MRRSPSLDRCDALLTVSGRLVDGTKEFAWLKGSPDWAKVRTQVQANETKFSALHALSAMPCCLR